MAEEGDRNENQNSFYAVHTIDDDEGGSKVGSGSRDDKEFNDAGSVAHGRRQGVRRSLDRKGRGES